MLALLSYEPFTFDALNLSEILADNTCMNVKAQTNCCVPHIDFPWPRQTCLKYEILAYWLDRRKSDHTRQTVPTHL